MKSELLGADGNGVNPSTDSPFVSDALASADYQSPYASSYYSRYFHFHFNRIQFDVKVPQNYPAPCSRTAVNRRRPTCRAAVSTTSEPLNRRTECCHRLLTRPWESAFQDREHSDRRARMDNHLVMKRLNLVVTHSLILELILYTFEIVYKSYKIIQKLVNRLYIFFKNE